MVEFGDIDRDGKNDMIFYDAPSSSIIILYNNISSNIETDDSLCKQNSDMGSLVKSGIFPTFASVNAG